MNKYQDKESSMDDYSHERKLRIDGRYEAAHGKMKDAKNDFDHASNLKKDAKHDAAERKGPSMYGSPAKMNISPMKMKGSWISKHCSK